MDVVPGMSAAVKTLPHPDARPRHALRPAPDLAAIEGRAAEFQPWELHSELVLVCPELRARSLDVLRRRAAAEGPTPAPPPAVIPRPGPEVEPPVLQAREVVAYTLRRAGESVRFGLTIVGLLVMLAMVAEALAR
jgi:hypothetical protein